MKSWICKSYLCVAPGVRLENGPAVTPGKACRKWLKDPVLWDDIDKMFNEGGESIRVAPLYPGGRCAAGSWVGAHC